MISSCSTIIVQVPVPISKIRIKFHSQTHQNLECKRVNGNDSSNSALKHLLKRRLAAAYYIHSNNVYRYDVRTLHGLSSILCTLSRGIVHLSRVPLPVRTHHPALKLIQEVVNVTSKAYTTNNKRRTIHNTHCTYINAAASLGAVIIINRKLSFYNLVIKQSL